MEKAKVVEFQVPAKSILGGSSPVSSCLGGLHKHAWDETIDSGYTDIDSSSSSLGESPFTSTPIVNLRKRKRSEAGEEFRKVIQAPLDALRPLLVSSQQRKAQLIRSLVLMVMIGSIGFGLFVGSKVPGSVINGKYAAIEHGAGATGDSLSGLTVVDREETGELLGGKRAAIQFYYDR